MVRLPLRLLLAAASFIILFVGIQMPIAAQPLAAPDSDGDAVPGNIPTIVQSSFAGGGTYGYFRVPDGTRLRFAIWRPQNGLQGTVVLLGGRGEFIEKYAGELVGELLGRGYAVYALDWRGQGAVPA